MLLKATLGDPVQLTGTPSEANISLSIEGGEGFHFNVRHDSGFTILFEFQMSAFLLLSAYVKPVHFPFSNFFYNSLAL